jgi:REase_AHJR-like
MALAPHQIDALFTSADVETHQVARAIIVQGLYAEALELAVVRAVEQGKQAYRDAQERYATRPGLVGPTPAQAARRRFLTSMEFEIELSRFVQKYLEEGYAVIIHPDQNQLPAFARDFAVDAMLTGDKESVLVQIKWNRTDLQADSRVPRQAEITNAQPGWRYDLILLGQPNPIRRTAGMAGEPTKEQIEQMIGEAEMVLKSGSPRAGFVLGWAGLEAALRRYAQQSGLDGRIGQQPTVLVREVYGVGGISPDDFQRLEAARQLRTEVVHGLAPSPIEPATVQVVINAAKKLLADGEALQPLAG